MELERLDTKTTERHTEKRYKSNGWQRDKYWKTERDWEANRGRIERKKEIIDKCPSN
jgi:hypothetical protein